MLELGEEVSGSVGTAESVLCSSQRALRPREGGEWFSQTLIGGE